MASEKFSLRWNNFHENISSGINALWKSQDFVDVTLSAQGKCIKAHKMVLSVCSPYFKEILKSNPCQHPIVILTNVTYEALTDLLQFIYHGEVQIRQEDLNTFIETAESLQIQGLTGDRKVVNDNNIMEISDKEYTKNVEDFKPVSLPMTKKQHIKKEEHSDIEQEISVALTINEFLNIASKMLPSAFDGRAGKLQSFLDALELLEKIAIGHEETAITLIKTRLTNKARNVITTEDTIARIAEALKRELRGDSPKTIIAKLAKKRQ
ncbi:unnamed protein product [Diabrotica balteata]|uniref:BTB domain-containing protein n=1 Tax=Diabrotica balteata TaxID=107213 RepID=A0A9N9X6U2_DIABA|nr:unnamed protein product [Diabrotica balteata]